MTDHEPRAGGDGAATELLFCAICQVSIASGEVERGEAMRTPRGRTFCAVCSRSTAEERVRRRKALEVEFADDAPVPVPARAASPGARRAVPGPSVPGGPAAASRGAAPAAATPSGANGAPGPAAPRVTVAPSLTKPPSPAPDPAVLDARVGELERAAFRLGARLSAIEEKLDAILKRLG